MKKIVLISFLSLVSVPLFAQQNVTQPLESVGESAIAISGDESLLYDALEYALKRIPNLEEIAIDVVTLAPVEVALFDWIKGLGNNPSAKSFVRDAIKVPSAISKSFRATQVGSTEFRFDRSNVWAQSAKALSKVGTIYVLVQGGSSPDKAAMTANHIGEYVSRFFVVAGKHHQAEKSTLSIEEFIVHKFDPKWIATGIAEAAPKVLVSNWMGWALEKTGLNLHLRSALTAVLNTVSPFALDNSVSFLANARQSYGAEPSFARRAAAISTVFALRSAVEIGVGMGVSYFMIPGSRIAQDLGGDIYQCVHPWIEAAHAWFKKDHGHVERDEL